MDASNDARSARPKLRSIWAGHMLTRFAEERRWSSKVDAAAWARERVDGNSIITEALMVRAGGRAQPLEAKRVRSFLEEVAKRIESSSD